MQDDGLFRNTLIIGLGTLLSRISGLLREILISSFFGATWITDAFLLAYTIPNLLRRLFAEGALSTSVVPVFSEYFVSPSRDDHPQDFISAVFSGFTYIVSLVCLLGVVLVPWILHVVAFSFRDDPVKFLFTACSTQIMFPFLLLISWSALLMGFLNTLNVFSWSAIAPFFFNLGTIVSLFVLRKVLGPYALALGVVLGGFWQFLFQLFPLYRKGFRLQLTFRFWKNKGFQKVFQLMLPVTFSLAVSQLNTLVDRVVASSCREGAVSALYFSDRLMEFPLGIFGVALSAAVLPPLSRSVWMGDSEEWRRTLWQGIRWVLFFMLPAVVFLMVFPLPLVTFVYQRGAFSASAAAMTATALFYYAPGLVFFALSHLVTRAFYSLHDTRTPVRVSLSAVLLNIGLDLWFVRFLDFAGVALATSLVAAFQFLFLVYFLRQKVRNLSLLPLGDWLLKGMVQIGVFTGCCICLRSVTSGTLGFVCTFFLLGGIYLMLPFILKMDERKALLSIFGNLGKGGGF
ncbi:MAG: murein biosynthesis integral membrane protein MurJ [Candidatus Caldatribacterium sp.]|uniref:murein biosynthesis integral membrane protein MurJ n=1 Tax=Candidatus Caldatribacterium sp. TaxID=2282143 RepID=UPI00299BE29C|nr:murein biosynthesis integral membrane protein MurJ [Candidatus Caldatribacterium sp.]MCX7730912.1 murein biosynthesis integral membrane protein MurJ [Candidatus Caldatribacterium sp.]MDW8080916.1 murein biosynthesis integral membrane protein MurJ [Candidatus Calescibacterium sp.]